MNPSKMNSKTLYNFLKNERYLFVRNRHYNYWLLLKVVRYKVQLRIYIKSYDIYIITIVNFCGKSLEESLEEATEVLRYRPTI